MNTRTSRFLTSLYPRRWRERYEQEFLSFLQSHSPSFSVIANVIGSALYQRFLAWGNRKTIFSEYTQPARRSVFFARYEACHFGSSSIEPEHLLLGVLRENSDRLSRFFADSSAVESVVHDTRAGVTIYEEKTVSTALPLSSACKRILAYSHEEATRLGDPIGPEHLFIGILREEESNVREILRKHGLQLDSAREKLAQLSKKN